MGRSIFWRANTVLKKINSVIKLLSDLLDMVTRSKICKEKPDDSENN